MAAPWSAVQTLDSHPTDFRSGPKIRINDAGNIVAVWVSKGTDDYDIYGSYYTVASGIWSTPTLIEDINDPDFELDTESLQMTIDNSGNATVVWSLDNGSYDDIYVNRFDAATESWGLARRLDIYFEDSTYPQIGSDDSGNVLVVWLQTLPTKETIMACRYDANTGWEVPVSLNTDGIINQWEPSLAVNAAGQALAVWTQREDFNFETDVVAQRYEPSIGWDPTPVLLDSLVGETENAEVLLDSQGNATVLWSQEVGTDDKLFANYYNASTQAWEGDEAVENLPSSIENEAKIAMSDNGKIMAVWPYKTNTNEYVFYANHFTVGSGWGVEEIFIPTTVNSPDFDIVMDNSGNAIMSHFENDKSGGQNATNWPVYTVTSRYNADLDKWNESVMLAPLRARRIDLHATPSGKAAITWSTRDNGYAIKVSILD